MFQTISTAGLESLLNEGGRFLLADVREPEAYERGHLEGAVNLPLSRIEQISELPGFSENPGIFLQIPTDRPVILYCDHGGNSMRAARELDRYGFQAVNVYGGLSCYRGRRFTGKRV